MVLDGVKEKYESEKEIGFYSNNSSFILCDCILENGEYVLKTIIPLANKIGKIRIDRENLMITDTSGKILKKFNKDDVYSTTIEYVNKDDLIISNYTLIKPNYVIKNKYHRLIHYHYDECLENVTTLYDANEDGRLEDFELVSEDTILTKTSCNYVSCNRLYSISKKEYVSPAFRELQAVEKTNNKIFQFTDRVNSSLVVDGISYSSKIIGFITVDGKFYNGVYDELSNKEIECELNSKQDFEEYYQLKSMIQGKLNEKVVKESNKKVTRNFIIKKLENKAKNIIKE